LPSLLANHLAQVNAIISKYLLALRTFNISDGECRALLSVFALELLACLLVCCCIGTSRDCCLDRKTNKVGGCMYVLHTFLDVYEETNPHIICRCLPTHE
jgi:hypothetical protein